MTQHPVAFEPLPFKKRTLIAVNPNRYEVRAVDGETRQVVAATAYEALHMSGITTAMKIERLSNIRSIVVMQERFEDEAAILDEDMPGLLSQLRRRATPVLTLAEMEAVMREFHAQASLQVSAPSNEDGLFSSGLHSPAAGLALAGDGFDEVLPTVPAPMPEPVAPAPSAEPVASAPMSTDASAPVEAASADPALQADRALSQEEIEALLKG